jgi:hypothetical protein
MICGERCRHQRIEKEPEGKERGEEVQGMREDTRKHDALTAEVEEEGARRISKNLPPDSEKGTARCARLRASRSDSLRQEVKDVEGRRLVVMARLEVV